MKEGLLFSAGMDSFIGWEYLGRPEAVYVNMHHRYAKNELLRIKEGVFQNTVRIVDLNLGRFEKQDAEIPQRNMYLAMIMANLGYEKIWIIVQKEEMSIPDRSPEFFKKASDMISFLMGKEIIVDTPFRDMDKVQMVKWYKNRDLSIDTLKLTWACYYPYLGTTERSVICADCPACFRRFVAMKLNGIEEDWHHKIYDSKVAKEYRARAKNGHYSEKRCKDILKALEV